MTRRRRFSALVAIAGCILLCAGWASAVEHPGSLEKDADCTSCHAKKTTGKSVHSAMTSPCTVCHVTVSQGDMTTVSLSMPKQRICFACHQEETASRLHSTAVKGTCVECHDPHASDKRMLLRDEDGPPLSALKTR